MVGVRVLLATLLACCALERLGVEAEIFSAPSNDVTVPLGGASVEFRCHGRGTFVFWKINNYEDPHYSEIPPYVDIHQDPHSNNNTVTTVLKINVTYIEANNTRLRCQAEQVPPDSSIPNENSITVTLTIAGPPLPPHPEFDVVNATHIKVQWDKPFSFPAEFDITNYTLTTRMEGSQSSNKTTFPVTTDTTYPIVHHISNGGTIAQECVHMNFTLTATNQVGTSNEGFATGGFPIVPAPIKSDSVRLRVTFSGGDFNPILHINFTFPTVCDYHDAMYSVLVRDETEAIVARTPVKTYDKERPDSVTVVLEGGMQKDTEYTAFINVTTAAGSTITAVPFKTCPQQPCVGGITIRNPALDDNKTIIAAAVGAGLFIVLLLVILIILVAFIMRRRKLKLVIRARQQVSATDEAVQRAALAMVHNPIYSGNPIYEEIFDSAKPKSLMVSRENCAAHPRDDGYVGISTDAAVKMVESYPIPEESKLVGDKYATFPEDTYTIMNPAGTLSNQTTSRPTDVLPPTTNATTVHNDTGMLSEEHTSHPLTNATTTTTQATTGNGLCARSAPNPTILYADDERYVMGAAFRPSHEQ